VQRITIHRKTTDYSDGLRLNLPKKKAPEQNVGGFVSNEIGSVIRSFFPL
jgi:hypothetical protein